MKAGVGQIPAANRLPVPARLRAWLLAAGVLVLATAACSGPVATTDDPAVPSATVADTNATPAGTSMATTPPVVSSPPADAPAIVGSTPDLLVPADVELRQLTDEAARGGRGTHEYSQLQAFSPDGALVLLAEGSAGGYVVKRLADLGRLPVDTSEWNVPRWHPALPATVVHMDSNEDATVRVQYTDVVTGATSTVFTFPERYERVVVPQSFDELSRDGRWMAGMVTRDDGAAVVFALDLVGAELTVARSIRDFYATDCDPDPQWGEVEPDWVGVSPRGRFLVVQWVRDATTRCSGLEVFDVASGGFAGQITTGHNHGDLGLDSDGAEVFVTTVLESVVDNNLPALVVFPLAPSSAKGREVTMLDWGDAQHISCQGPPGLCVATSGSTGGRFDGAVWLAGLDGATRTLAEHRSSSCGYWVQPRASISRDGRYVVFDSDGAGPDGPSSCQLTGEDLGRGDAWLIDLRP